MARKQKAAPQEPAKLAGQDPESNIDPEALRTMRERGGEWYAYRNEVLDSAGLGHLKFLKCGEGCTFTEPPKPRLPDTASDINWKYQFAGKVDVQTGLIEANHAETP